MHVNDHLYVCLCLQYISNGFNHKTMKSERMPKQIENFMRFFLLLLLISRGMKALAPCEFVSMDKPTRLFTENIWKSFSISCFRIVGNFMGACSCRIRYKNKMNIGLYINSIYGEHNLQKFTQ